MLQVFLQGLLAWKGSDLLPNEPLHMVVSVLGEELPGQHDHLSSVAHLKKDFFVILKCLMLLIHCKNVNQNQDFSPKMRHWDVQF